MTEFHLQPGDLLVSRSPCKISTILGSCVAVVIYDQRQKCGGMNHFVHPIDSNQLQTNHFAPTALINLLRKVKYELKSDPQDLVIKIIGGAQGEVLEQLEIGKKNVAVAREYLQKMGLAIASEEVGGHRGRKVLFDTGTGELKFKYLASKNEESTVESKAKIRVLIVDDAAPVRMVLKKIISSDPLLEVVGEAADPFEAMEIRKRQDVDVITLDLNMPKMDGLTYLKEYLRQDKVPTILITEYDISSSQVVLEALENGAFDYLKKPSITDLIAAQGEVNGKIKAAFQRRFIPPRSFYAPKITFAGQAAEKNLILLGASTGGTEAIREILVQLPANIPPILVVQHIPPVFSRAFADRLSSLCAFEVSEAIDGERVLNNHVYIAPGGLQMGLRVMGGHLSIAVNTDPPVNRFRPSVDYLFHSVAKAIPGRHLIGVILTGMGDDGAAGLLHLKKLQAITIAQDEESCVVFGMPKAAIKLGAANHVVSLEKIPRKLAEVLQKQ